MTLTAGQRIQQTFERILRETMGGIVHTAPDGEATTLATTSFDKATRLDLETNANSLRRVLSRLNRSLTNYEFSLEMLDLRTARAGAFESAFIERYVEHYLQDAGGADEIRFSTEGLREHYTLFEIGGDGTLSLVIHILEDPAVVPALSWPERRSLPCRAGFGSPGHAGFARRTAAPWAWNPAAARDYADQFAVDPNPEYSVYPQDCTNFVSQCLKAGGKTEVGTVFGRQDDENWFHGPTDFLTSYTWAGCQNLFRHLNSYTNSTVVTLADLQPGDLVFQDIHSEPDPVEHAMIVVRRLPNDVTVNYHTPNTKNRSLQDILGHRPQDTFYGIRLGTH